MQSTRGRKQGMMMVSWLYLQEGHQANPGSEAVAGSISTRVRHCLCLHVIETFREAIGHAAPTTASS